MPASPVTALSTEAAPEVPPFAVGNPSIRTASTEASLPVSLQGLAHFRPSTQDLTLTGRSAEPVRRSDSHAFDKTSRDADTKWVRGLLLDYRKNTTGAVPKLSERELRKERENNDIVGKFIRYVQTNHLFQSEEHKECVGLTRNRYLSLLQAFKLKKFYEILRPGNKKAASTALDELHDALFACDLHQLMPRYRDFFAKERHAKWANSGLRAWDHIRKMENSRISFLFDVNRQLLDDGAGLLQHMADIARTRQVSWPEALRRAQELEAKIITDRRPERGYLQDFLEFHLNGPEHYQPALPPTHDINGDIAWAAGETPRHIAAPLPGADLVASLRRKMFDDHGVALVRRDAEYLIREEGEGIRIRCLGDAQGNGPFYQEAQLDNAQSCSAHAIGSFLNPACDIEVQPVALTLKEYRAEAARARIDFEGGALDGVPEDDRDFASAVLRRLNASHKPVTFELLYFLTARQAVHFDPSLLSTSSQCSLPSAQIAQIRSYFDLIGFSSQGVQFFKGGLWKNSPDWPFLREMIDGHANSSNRMIICYASHVALGIGHFVAAHRKRNNRKWVLVDSTRFDQPGLVESRNEWRPSNYLVKDVMWRAEAFELILPETLDDSLDEDVVHQSFFQYYNSVLSSARFSDAVDALSAFCQYSVSKIVLDQHRQEKKNAYVDENDGPMFDYTDLRPVDLFELAEFLDASARSPADAAHAEVTDIDVIIWENVAQFMRGLDDLREKHGVDRVILGGWATSPYFVAAAYDTLAQERDPQWYILHGNYKGQTLGAFLPELIASLPIGSNLNAIEVLSLSEPYRSIEGQASMPARVAQWCAARMNWMVESVRNGEQRVRDRLAAEQQREQERISASGGDPGHENPRDDAEHDSDLGSLFDEHSPPASGGRHVLALPPQPNRITPPSSAGNRSVPLLHTMPPALQGTRAPSSASRANLENLIAGRPRAPYPYSYAPKEPRSIAYARTSSRYVDPSRLSFRKGGMLNFLRRADVRVEIDPSNAESILERFRVEAAADPHYARFTTADDLVAALNAYLQDVGLGYLSDNQQDEFNSQVRLIWARSGVFDLTQDREDSQYGEVAVPLLVQMTAHSASRPQKRVEITDMRPATQPNLISMILSRGARQWQFRALVLGEQTARLALERLRIDCMRENHGFPPAVMLESLGDPEAFLGKIQDALRRDDDEAAEVITARLWRVTIGLGDFDVRLLLTKRGNLLQDIHLDNRENRLLLLEQVNNADERRKGLVNRLMDAPDNVLDRFLLHLNNNSGGLPYSYFDALATIERQRELDQLDNLPEEYAPLQQLAVEIPGGDRLTMLVLFEAGEAVDLREDAEETMEQTRRDMLRLSVGAAVAEKLAHLMAHAENDDVRNDKAADGAMKEMHDLVNALAIHARMLPDDNSHRNREEAPLGIDTLLEVLSANVRRGTGEIIHYDYPDLKKYELALMDSSGEARKLPVLIRLKHIDHPEDEDKIREIMSDTEIGRRHMLAYQLRAKELTKILAYDLGQNWHDTGHGPLCELARMEYRNEHRNAEDIGSSRLRKLTADFIRKVVKRDAQGAIPIPGFPEIARYPTQFRDEVGNRVYLLARVCHSQIRAVRLDTPAEFMNMALHKGDPGDYLQTVRSLLPPHSTADDLQSILQPFNEDRDSIPPDYPAYSNFSYARDAQEAALQQPQFVGRLEGKLITELAPADRFGELAKYKVPVRFMAPIRAFDTRNGRFIRRHVPPGQTFWEFVTQHVRRDNKQALTGFPQLGRYPVPSTSDNGIALVARVESGEIWEVGEYSRGDQRVLRRMEKHIERDLRGEARRAVWHYEKRLRSRRVLDTAIERVKRRQRDLQDPQMVARMQEQSKALVIQKSAKRDTRAEVLRLSMQQAIRPRQSTNMTALFDGEDLVSAITELLDEEDWEPVTHHADQEILRKTNGRRDEDGNLLYLYAFMRKNRLRDVRVGNADELQSLIDQRRREMATVAGTELPHLPLDVVREIWSLDRYNGGLLMEFADRAQKTFPDWLRSSISQPEMINGRPVFKDGEPVRDRAGHPIEWLRRYPVGPAVDGRTWHLIGEFDADRSLEDPEVQIRLADAYVVPADDSNTGYRLSSSLRALWDYLATGAVVPVGLPTTSDTETVVVQRAPMVAVAASPFRESADTRSRSGLFVDQDSHSPPNAQDAFNSYLDGSTFVPVEGSIDPGDHAGLAHLSSDWTLERHAPPDSPVDATGFQSNRPWDLDDLIDMTLVDDGNGRLSPNRDPSASDAPATQSEPRDARLRRGDSLLRELEAGPPAPEDLLDEVDWDALFEAMNAEPMAPEALTDAVDFQPSESWDWLTPSDTIRQPVDRLLADVGIDPPSPSADSPASGGGPMIYAVHRIDYDNEDAIERLMEDLYDTHGEGVHDQLIRALSPDEDTQHLETRFWYWLSRVAQPDRERTVNPKHPQLKSFSLGLLGDKAEPVRLLATVCNNLVGRPWVDNPKNEGDLIKKLDHEWNGRKSGFEEAIKSKTALSMKVAGILASRLKLSDATLSQLRSSLAAQALGTELLKTIDIEERKKDPSLVNAKKSDVFRAFLIRGLRDALVQPRSNARLLTIPTSARDIDGSTLNIVATVRGNSIAQLWAASTAKRQRRRPLDLVRQQMEQEVLIEDVPYIKTRKASRRRPGNLADAGMNMMQAKPYSRQGARFKEVRSVLDASTATNLTAGEMASHAAPDPRGVNGGGLATGLSEGGVKRRADASAFAEPESPAKRRRTSDAGEPRESTVVTNDDAASELGSPMFIDDQDYPEAEAIDEPTSAITVPLGEECDWQAGISRSPLFASEALEDEEDARSLPSVIDEVGTPQTQSHVETFSDTGLEEKHPPVPQDTRNQSPDHGEDDVVAAPYRNRLRGRTVRPVVEDTGEAGQGDKISSAPSGRGLRRTSGARNTRAAPDVPKSSVPSTSTRSRSGAAHQSKIMGVNWVASANAWQVRVRGPNDSKRQHVSFAVSRYGNDVDRARRAAEERAEQIRAGTYEHQLRPQQPAIHQSAIPRVVWDKSRNAWLVRVKGPNDSKPQRVAFFVSRYENDVDRARQEAEACAKEILAGTYEHQPHSGKPAVHQSAVPGVTWKAGNNRWVVQIKGPNDSKLQHVTFAVSRYGNDVDRARQAAERRAEQIRAGTYEHQPCPKEPAVHQSAVPGVTWAKRGNAWQVRVKGPNDSTHQRLTFAVSQYDNNIDFARQTAEACAEEIRAGTYEHHAPRQQPAVHQSAIPGVVWFARDSLWLVQIKGPNDSTLQRVTFAISRYENNVDLARQEAEACAKEIKAGTYVHQSRPKLAAVHRSAVPGVNWDKRKNAWLVRVKGPNDSKPNWVPFFVSRYENDVDRARQDAEDCAEQIRAGTYKHQSRPRQPAVHQSAVPGVSWNTREKAWKVSVKGPNNSKRQSVTFVVSRYENDVDRARQDAEDCAEQIRAGTYEHESRPKQPAAHQSAVRGVSWDGANKAWAVSAKGPDDSTPRRLTFTVSRYENDVDRARQAAEACANEIRAGTYVQS